MKDLTLKVELPNAIRSRDIKLDINVKRLLLQVNGITQLEGTYDHPEGVDPDDSFWTLEEDPNGTKVLSITLGKKEVSKDALGYEPWTKLLEDESRNKSVTHHVFFDIKVGSKEFGRIVFGLYGDVAPRTVENFRALCTGEQGDSPRGVRLSYKGSQIFRIMPRFLIHGGDIVHNDGTGGESIYGGVFQDESLALPHDTAGVLAMSNTGPNTNTSQFHIMLGAHSFLNGKHVVFGQVLAGMEMLALLEKVPTGENDRPTLPVIISNCGELSREEVEQMPAAAALAQQARRARMDIGGRDWVDS